METKKLLRNIIIIAAVVSVSLTAFLVFSFNTPVSTDKWLYEMFNGQGSFERDMYDSNVSKAVSSFIHAANAVRNSKGEIIHIYDINTTSYGDCDFTFNGNKAYIEFIAIRNDTGNEIKMTYEGVRKWYFDYDWKPVFNEALPDLIYEAKWGDLPPLLSDIVR